MEGINYYIKIGPYIKELREKNNMTKSQLADGICSISYITRIENGERCPTSVILRQITNKLGITPEYLFRAIESPTSLQVKDLLDQIFTDIEKHNFKNIYKLIIKKEKELDIRSIHDMQIIETFKCISTTFLNENYHWGMDEVKNILAPTYIEGSNPTDIEFMLLFSYGCFLLLSDQQEKAYAYLKNIEKYLDNIQFLHTRVLFPAFYIFLIAACLDTSNFKEASLYLNATIDYCKKYNTYSYLRELYFLKSELFDHLNNDKEFTIWYNKALMLHELIKNSDDEYFDVFIKNRLKKLKTS
ncbi:helix-turn-helix transcriptional regulator [Romboutsia sp.]|uniref:helix-turn-helix domain-containing protein n=1 Tax=Romboutsia sp. TaxID=1965302 RepID=UPI002C4EE077|nr:helix-turn-helix transcriptional regulator [Romboutsia sp.]HSQ87736.1 helix-turn-helix transcriptional regulator [Romboutsia sp.]